MPKGLLGGALISRLLSAGPGDRRNVGDEVETLVRDAMSSAYELEVPLVVDTGYGRNWAEAKA